MNRSMFPAAKLALLRAQVDTDLRPVIREKDFRRLDVWIAPLQRVADLAQFSTVDGVGWLCCVSCHTDPAIPCTRENQPKHVSMLDVIVFLRRRNSTTLSTPCPLKQRPSFRYQSPGPNTSARPFCTSFHWPSLPPYTPAAGRSTA